MRPSPLSGVGSPRTLGVLSTAVLFSLSAGRAHAQTGGLTYSLDFQGPRMGTQPATGGVITDADLLSPTGSPFDPDLPRITLPATFLDAYTSCAGHLAGLSCGLEINAFSFGRDARLMLDPGYEFVVLLSVDEFAVGTPPPIGTTRPTIFSEAQAAEAAGDIFGTAFQGPGPFQLTPGTSQVAFDGDGQPATSVAGRAPGLGLVEPIPPTATAPDLGDNLDAFDLGRTFDPANDFLFFSLQGGFPFCQESGVSQVDAAAGQSIAGSTTNARSADILVFNPSTGTVQVYASADELGLDNFGIGTDDIDALVVVENGLPGYQPPQAFYDWTGPTPSDLVLFSLRCGSQTLGLPDANFGQSMSEGDILLTLGGAQGTPGIFIGAESLGLEVASRGGMFNDELDGIDILDDTNDPFNDCNMNGIDDTIDIIKNTSLDNNSDGIPDECQKPGEVFCDCFVAGAPPCGNGGPPDVGCANAVGLHGALTGIGTSSLFHDDLQFKVEDLPPQAFGLLFAGLGVVDTPLGNGRRCVGTPGNLWRMSIFQANNAGGALQGPGIPAALDSIGAPSVTVGSTFGFQCWYRDSDAGMPGGPCGTGSNLTNGVAVTFSY